MSLYIVAIGGTGARCVEALIHLAAAGLLTQDRIQVLFIDPDESNGNLTRTRNTLKLYQDCRALVIDSAVATPWLQTPIESLEVWSPFQDGGNKTLGTFFNYESYRHNNTTLGHLFDVLYTKGERDAELDVGFRGRPAIGAAIMSQVRLERGGRDVWSQLIQNIELDLGQGKFPRVFLCGSIFGGTGASGFPTIGRLLKNRLDQAKASDRVKLGGLLMLPYFQFSVPPGQDPGDIYARPEQFLLNTEAALRYYQIQGIFKSIYLLGDQDPATIKNFSIGKNNQQNDPHFIELYAALAVRHFFLSEETAPVVLLSRRTAQQITWDDVPDRTQVKTRLANTARFAFLWVANLEPELSQGKANIGEFQKLAPWFSKYFRPKGWFVSGKGLPDLNDDLQQEGIRAIHDWCVSFLQWLGTLHYSGGEVRNVQLFRANLFLDRNGQVLRTTEDFTRLVLGAEGLEQANTASPKALKEQLALQSNGAPGSVGLAAALYDLCKP
ncbi:MAG: hypothetical protein WCD18_05405 [Thermosynechococcaceae cyanobacterium]